MKSARVGVIDYHMGNIASVVNAFRAIDVEVFRTERGADLHEASHLVLPGVGAFPNGMQHLRELGLVEALTRLVVEDGRPLLGICLGMQLFATWGEEHERCPGLGLVPGRVTRLNAGDLRLPHVGWNDTMAVRDNALLAPPGTVGCFYYVHSYHMVPEDASHIALECVYGQRFTAGIQRDHIVGTQFHPEKSHVTGLALLKRFVQMPGRRVGGTRDATAHAISTTEEHHH